MNVAYSRWCHTHVKPMNESEEYEAKTKAELKLFSRLEREEYEAKTKAELKVFSRLATVFAILVILGLVSFWATNCVGSR